MRRILVGIAAACLTVGTVCFGAFFVQVARFMIDMPGLDMEKDLGKAAPIQRWGWYFFGLYVAGFVILFLLPDRGGTSSAGPGAAPDPPAPR
jgi:hypothetical protein